MVKQGDEVLAGNTKNTNTLQLGTPQNVTFPFTAPSDGILMVSAYPNNGQSVFIDLNDDAVNKSIGAAKGVAGGWVSTTFVLKAGHTYSKTKNWVSTSPWDIITFYPFIPTTGEPVKQTYDPTSVEPISGAGVAAALNVYKRVNGSITNRDVQDSNVLNSPTTVGKFTLNKGVWLCVFSTQIEPKTANQIAAGLYIGNHRQWIGLFGSVTDVVKVDADGTEVPLKVDTWGNTARLANPVAYATRIG